MFSSSLGEAVLDLRADDKPMMGDIDKAKKTVLSKMDGWGQAMTGAGQKMTVGLTLPILGLAAYGVNAASDLGESVNAVNTVFGDASDGVLAFGENSAEAVGLANEEFNSLAAQSGALLQNLGYDANEAGEEVIVMGQRASDMASVFNTEVPQAMGAFGSALKGEFNPLEAYGVKLNAASVEAKALEMGLADVTTNHWKIQKAQIAATKAQDEYNQVVAWYGEETPQANEALADLRLAQQKLTKEMEGSIEPLSDNAKAQATMALIYEQTDRIAGDFANTSDQLANKKRIVTAEIKDQAAALGGRLLPYVLRGLELFSGLIDRFQVMSPAMQNLILVVGGLAAAAGPLLMVIGTMMSGFATLAGVVSGPLLLGIAGVAAAVALLGTAWTQNWGGIQEKMGAFWASLGPMLNRLKMWLGVFIPLALEALGNYWATYLQPALSAIGVYLQTTLLPVLKWLGEAIMKDVVMKFKALWAFISQYVLPFLLAIGKVVSGLLTVAFKALAGLFQNVIIPKLKELWSWLAEKLGPTFETFSNWLDEKVAPALRNIGDAISGVIDWISRMGDMLHGLSLPDWLTPGSPTPWETGLWGIHSALKKVGGMSLPTLSNSLGDMPVPGLGVPGMATSGAGGGGGTVVVNYAPFVSTRDEREATRLMRNVVNNVNRENANK